MREVFERRGALQGKGVDASLADNSGEWPTNTGSAICTNTNYTYYYFVAKLPLKPLIHNLIYFKFFFLFKRQTLLLLMNFIFLEACFFPYIKEIISLFSSLRSENKFRKKLSMNKCDIFIICRGQEGRDRNERSITCHCKVGGSNHPPGLLPYLHTNTKISALALT